MLPEEGGSGLSCSASGKSELAWRYSSTSSVSLQDSKQGAVPVLYLSLAKELDGISGKHFSSSCVITPPPEAAQDPHVAQSLWNTSVRLTNLDKVD